MGAVALERIHEWNKQLPNLAFIPWSSNSIIDKITWRPLPVMMSPPVHAQHIWCSKRDDIKGHLLTLNLHVQPGAKRTEASGLHGDALKIRLSAPATEGAANAELLKFIARTFRVPLCQVTLKRGWKSRRKIIEVRETLHGPEALYGQAQGT